MRALFLLLIFLSCSTSLYAEKMSILTEIELIQEKLWKLNRETGAYKASLEEQKKELGLMASGAAKHRLELDERLNALTQATAGQQEKMVQLENDLVKFGESLAALAAETNQDNGFLLEQAKRIGALEGALNALRGELVTQETNAGLALTDLRTQLAEARSRIDALGQDMGGRVEQIGYWGAGAALLLVITLTIGIALRKR